MKTYILLCLFICFSLFTFGQKDLSGIYCNESGMCIKIENDKFYFIVEQGYSIFWSNDTLAEATFKWIDDNFIELNSIPPYILVKKDFKMIQSFDSTINDSVKLSFSIPYQIGDLDINVRTDSHKTFRLNYSEYNGNRELMLPHDTRTIHFTIYPQEYRPSHSFEGLYYGTLYYAPRVENYLIEKNINHISIEIPAIDDSFFERYYIKGEYARISGDTITWKGEVFIKEK
jgi:hypothetical protein